MKIAITADLHLTPEYPERAFAFKNILEQLEAEGISDLIIAGDLFDKDGDDSAYESFRTPCRAHPFLKSHIIPGNHDSTKSLRDISPDLANVKIYSSPTFKLFDNFGILFIPYCKGISMGEAILQSKEKIEEGIPWGLVGHGDFIEGQREPNPREKGVYMPLKQGDLNDANLCQVFLGHIHKPTPLDQPLAGKVIYPGSPQGLDITESGSRRFLVYDTESGRVTDRMVNSSIIYLNETFLVFPSIQEQENLYKDFEERLLKTNLSSKELLEKTHIRIKIEGFALDKEGLVDSFCSRVKEFGITLFKGIEPDFNQVITASDEQKKNLSLEALLNVDRLAEGTSELFPEKVEGQSKWIFGGNEPTMEQVRMEVLRTIYKG